MNFCKNSAWLKIVLPVTVLLFGIAAALTLVMARKPLPAQQNQAPPEVRTITVYPERMRVPVQSQGVLMPVREIDLVAEVQGKVVALHPDFAAGGHFKAGDVLVAIAPGEYDLAIARSESRLAEAKRALAEEQAAALQAQREWRVLGEGTPTPLSLHEPQLQEARAKLKEAKTELAEAKQRRSFCEIRAPFSGRVREKHTGVGQFVEIGTALGRIYGDDAAEIRLPLTQEQTAYLQSPGQGGKTPRPKVTLSVERNANQRERQAVIVRREGTVEQATGLEYWVARLDYPDREPALMPGSFVSAEIEGRELDGVFILPPGALNASQEALLVDANNHLQIKHLTVLSADEERVLVGAGLTAGDRVIISGVDVPVAGMEVAVQETAEQEKNKRSTLDKF